MNIQTKKRLKVMKKFLGNCENDVVLDIGVGEINISKNLDTKKTITLDAVSSLHPDIVCDINEEEIPLAENSVDKVIAGELIEHMINPVKFLGKIHKILKNNGELILSTPNIASLKNRVKLLVGLMPEYSCMAHPDGEESFQSHIKDFNYKYLKLILEKNGFKVIKFGTNGIVSHNRIIFPLIFTPNKFGECLIIKCRKIG